MIDRWASLWLLFVVVLLLTPLWRSFYAARLPWLYLVVLACGLALFATPLVREVARRWGVLDLPVNFASERGLLGITLHPNFASNGWVYLYYTRSSLATSRAGSVRPRP